MEHKTQGPHIIATDFRIDCFNHAYLSIQALVAISSGAIFK